MQYSEFLPIGSHLLPQSFQEFLVEFNKEMRTVGGWQFAEKYERDFPTRWAAYLAVLSSYTFLYREAVEAVKAYQLKEEGEIGWVQKCYRPSTSIPFINLAELPPLPESPDNMTPPPSPVLHAASDSHTVASVTERLVEADTRLKAIEEGIAGLIDSKLQTIPKNTMVDSADIYPQAVSPLPEDAEFEWHCNYNHVNWPSPVPKLFVQMLKKIYGSRDLNNEWRSAGLPPINRLTHDDCIFFLHWKMKSQSIQDFLNLTPTQVSHTLFPYDVFSYGNTRSKYW